MEREQAEVCIVSHAAGFAICAAEMSLYRFEVSRLAVQQSLSLQAQKALLRVVQNLDKRLKSNEAIEGSAQSVQDEYLPLTRQR